MTPQFDNSHDWALWLFAHLEEVQEQGQGLWSGRVPLGLNFQEIADAIAAQPQLAGMADEGTRSLEFYPAVGKVYQSLAELFSHPTNLRAVPTRFTIRDIDYTHDAGTDNLQAPPVVANYYAAATVCHLLALVADMPSHNGGAQHFIKSPEARIEIKLEYRIDDLVAIPSLPLFATDFATSTHHQDQKRSIIRSVLLDAFKGKRYITVGDLLPRFESLVENVRSNYSMYAAEFSFEKIKAEVEKDNLDSTLRLNKIFSDMQNQLLAMPVALVLVGGQMTPEAGLSIKNVVIWLGAVVFSILMMLLIRNQRHAINAISEEIRLRKVKVDAQPDGVAGKFKAGFDDLEARSRTQTRTLHFLQGGVLVSVVLATGLLMWFSNPTWRDDIKTSECNGDCSKISTGSGIGPTPSPAASSSAKPASGTHRLP